MEVSINVKIFIVSIVEPQKINDIHVYMTLVLRNV